MFYSTCPWAEFSTLEVAVCVQCTQYVMEQPNLKLKRGPKQLLDYQGSFRFYAPQSRPSLFRMEEHIFGFSCTIEGKIEKAHKF
jgi:hypothetical protein